ncbi:NAD-dependent epimerase/dehydratase family protein [Patiriisocius hiemis]|uniref:NAD(P)-dependent oxidoreductase n=1 Tax=Patiriisocius hiemis TaxID=3075604 RepID=A0ABU2YEY1_9FLAO|nr:NAD(P)-dependent oxidoreductase [Constantimarinum sp. W242]MDT0556748.1 NAD(P)-dependent oxidoreductase [Constantimarinum sp. W242]
MKILITGAAGFIGSHIAERLATTRHNVFGVDNFSPYYNATLKKSNALSIQNKGVTFQELDLRTASLENLLSEKFDVIFHFAAHPGISSSSTFDDYLSNNVIATQRLLDLIALQNKKPFFVNISTSSVYGLEATFPETHPAKPASWYGVTKLAAEQLVLSYQRRGVINATSLRLFSVYGPRERPDKLYTRLIDSAINNKPFPLFNGSEKHLRSYTYVQDIVDGICSVLDKQEICNGEIFNLGTEVENSTLMGIKTVEKLLNLSITIQNMPARIGDQSRTHANIEKARKLLNYNPTTTLEEGVAAQIEWFKGLSKF